MKILVNPSSPPEELLEFEWVSDSMNAPGKWVVNQKEKLRPVTLTLDGHSTVLVYSLENGKGSWKSLRDLGTYVFIPEHLGEGAVFLPHEYETTTTVSFEEYDLSVKIVCDAEELEAITLELKGQDPDTILEALDSTLHAMIVKTIELHSSELPFDQGKNMVIPKKIIEQLNYSLGILGFKLRKIQVLDVQKKAPIPRVKIDDEILERDMEDKLIMHDVTEEVFSEEELEEIPVPPKAHTQPHEESVKAQPSSESEKEMGVPVPSATPPLPPPPGKQLPPPSPVSVPLPGESSSTAIPHPKEPSKEEVVSKRRKTLRSEEQQKTEKIFTNISWYDRMILQRTYPLSIVISLEELPTQAPVSSVISGERVTEEQASMDVSAREGLIVRPEFPGCLVTPVQKIVNVLEGTQLLRFWVTPLAKGDIEAKIVFEQGGRVIKEVTLQGKVITHRVAKIFGWLGVLASAVPPAFAFLFNETPSDFYRTRLSTFLPQAKDLGIALNIGIAGLLFVASGLFYVFDRQKQNQMSGYIVS